MSEDGQNKGVQRSALQVGDDFLDQLSRVHDASRFPRRREVPLVSGHQVLSASCLGAFQKYVVVGVAGYLKLHFWNDTFSGLADLSE